MSQRPRSVSDLYDMKSNKEPLAWITAYDYPSAICAELAEVDMILVGDSGAMVQYGFPNTSGISMNLMLEMCRAVRRGADRTLLVGDMPRGSYELSDKAAIHNALKFVIRGQCDLVKLEGSNELICDRVSAITNAGVSVIGHVGLTPQSLGYVSPYRMPLLDVLGLAEFVHGAVRLVDAGAVALLVEAVPPNATALLRKFVSVPVYGIGSGQECDGQLLILHDILGYYPRFRPKFAKVFVEYELDAKSQGALKDVPNIPEHFAKGVGEIVCRSLALYTQEVRNKNFPADSNCYPKLANEIIRGAEEVLLKSNSGTT